MNVRRCRIRKEPEALQAANLVALDLDGAILANLRGKLVFLF